MASQAAAPEQQEVPQVQVEQQQQEQDAGSLENGIEIQMDGLSVGNGNGKPESELHAACAEGRLEDLRAVLSRTLEGLESLDMASGCTPIVLAIRGNHHDVVRELLSAGAIVPPPGLTNDSLMLSILYPQPMYGLPPQFMGMPPQEFYGQPNFYQGPGQQIPPHLRKESPSNGLGQPNGAVNPNNLPPAEVSKTIPCRNFPNCKYGAACVFYHPRPQQFFPVGPAPAGSFVPQGFEGGYPAPYPPAGPYFVPQNGSFNPAFDQQQQQQQQSSHPQPESIPEQSATTTTQHDHTQTQDQQAQHASSQHVPSAVAPVFIPGYQAQPIPGPNDIMTSPPPPSQFGLSPLSPSMLGSSLPSIPPAEAFFAATSPPNGFLPPQMNGHARRQSFNQQQQFGAPGKPFGHGKKPSFSGGPKPWLARQPMANGSAKLGSWKDGNPPPCAFFAQGNCRNGEYCKFPHLDAEGTDCRHPDIIRGVIPPLPSLSRQPRGMRMMGPGFAAPFDPAFRQQQQHQQQIQFLQHQRMAAAQAQQGGAAAPAADGEIVANDTVAVDGEHTEASTSTPETAEQATPTASSLPASVPPKPTAAPAVSAASLPAIVRSASQPGVQRVHVNGVSSRSHSPAPSNVSFHGNGHPRRAGRVPQINGHAHLNGHANVNGNGVGRSTSHGSAEKAKPSQRIPGAHEFPALGTPTAEKKEPSFASGTGKTAAQVLSAPAPPKPVVVKVTSADGDDNSSEKSDKQSVTMDSESEGDAVIISTKSSGSGASTSANANTPTPTTNGAIAPVAAPAQETKRAPISFASVASAVSLPTLEASPVALKA